MKKAPGPYDPQAPFYVALRIAGKRAIEFALDSADNDWELACSRLGLTPHHFKFYCKEFGIELEASTTANTEPQESEEPHDDAADPTQPNVA